MRLFLDTEWANDAVRELVSLGLVSADGQHRFYAERDPLPLGPSSFVREVVYPLLERGKCALQDEAFAVSLQTFVRQFEAPVVIADGALDFKFFAHVLNGFGRSGMPPPPDYRPMLMSYADVQVRVEEYFDRNSLARACRHHALVDAEALRWAFEGIVRQTGESS